MSNSEQTDIKELAKIIEFWSSIEKQHFDARIEAKELFAMRKQQKLCDKAHMVVAALRHYKITLETY